VRRRCSSANQEEKKTAQKRDDATDAGDLMASLPLLFPIIKEPTSPGAAQEDEHAEEEDPKEEVLSGEHG
jgi:hypothetical protein